MLRNAIVIVTLLLVALLPFVTKEHDADVQAGIRIVRNVAYVDGQADRLQKLDLYLPRIRSAKPLPLVVWIHGGAWRGGDKEESPAFALADKGFAAACINYRFTQTDIFPAQLDDCRAAIAWLKAHASEYGYDANAIGVWGASAGGHLAALLGTTFDGYKSESGDRGRRIKAICDFCGTSDMKSFPKDAMQPRFRAIQPEQFIYELLGGTPEEKPDLAFEASPVNFVSADDPPFLVVHSIEDPVVPFAQSNEFVKRLEQAGVKVKFIKLNSKEHMPFTDSTLNAVYQFFKEELSSASQ